MQSNYPQRAPEQQSQSTPEAQMLATRLYIVSDSVQYMEAVSASAEVIPYIARQATESFDGTQEAKIIQFPLQNVQNPVAEQALNLQPTFLEQANANVDDAYETAA
jgi:hypothetical protein